MHYTLLVILTRPPMDLRSHVTALLAPFQLENKEGVRPCWDWFTIGDGPFSDAPAALSFPDLDESERTCVCRVGQLPADYSAAALLTPDGAWHDIEDFGWRMLDGESERNRRADEAWSWFFKETIARYPDAIGLEVHCHG